MGGQKPDSLLRKPVTDVNGTIIPNYNVIYEFAQLVDHANPSLGTFIQRYYHTWEFYKPGGPIVLTTPGEQSMDGSFFHLTNRSMSGTIAQATNGAVVILEHRYYGESQPFRDMSVAHLEYHTIAQAMDDLVYFAQNVNLTMPGGDTDAIRPHKAPWILLGGSYAGALTSWTLNQKPGVFWAGYSSSGVIQPLLNFYQYFNPIQSHMPANCSADVQAAIQLVDSVIDSGDAASLADLQAAFGLDGIKTSDFANALTYPVSDWQTLDVDDSHGSVFFDFCDALEVSGGQAAPASGFGAEQAVTNWGRFYRTGYLTDLCQGFSLQDCVAFDGIYSSSPTIDDDRSWWWQVCSEVGWAQVGPPAGVNGIVSQHFTVQDYSDYCDAAFSGAFSESFQARVDATSKKYLGWNTTANRLFVVNGNRDPWVEVTHSASAARIASTSSTPIFLTDGFHCSDLSTTSLVDPTIAEVYAQAVTVFPQWVSEFTPSDKPVQTESSSGSSEAKNSAWRTQTSGTLALGVAILASVGLVTGL
ncbi:peptidase S28 [Coprinellus micaceus]|uniref:Peptidase S28 n=1 Tax=Coprinellus micaceus TaxID=71717 RepID=A0A4Y7T1I2_COPMI|nr:peptidase S28 [Coprinellus micaceus]